MPTIIDHGDGTFKWIADGGPVDRPPFRVVTFEDGSKKIEPVVSERPHLADPYAQRAKQRIATDLGYGPRARAALYEENMFFSPDMRQPDGSPNIGFYFPKPQSGGWSPFREDREGSPGRMDFDQNVPWDARNLPGNLVINPEAPDLYPAHEFAHSYMYEDMPKLRQMVWESPGWSSMEGKQYPSFHPYSTLPPDVLRASADAYTYGRDKNYRNWSEHPSELYASVAENPQRLAAIPPRQREFWFGDIGQRLPYEPLPPQLPQNTDDALVWNRGWSNPFRFSPSPLGLAQG